MKMFLTVFMVLNFPVFLTAQQSSLSWLDGEWEGLGYQLNNGGTWSIRFSGQSANNSFTIQYPSLKCGGNWMITGCNEYRAEFVEVISFGTDFCVNGGIVVLTRVDDLHIAFTYFSPQRTLDAFSTLIKKN